MDFHEGVLASRQSMGGQSGERLEGHGTQMLLWNRVLSRSFLSWFPTQSQEQGETLQVTFQGKRYPLVAKSETVRIY